jgi:hypothetical protein
LKSITIPSGVKKIEVYAFMTNSLSEAIFETTNGWYTYWYGEKQNLDYTFEAPTTAALHLANENYPFYHD